MQYIIENNDFKVTVDSKGCEVVSVLKSQMIRSIYGVEMLQHGNVIRRYYFRLSADIKTTAQYMTAKSII